MGSMKGKKQKMNKIISNNDEYIPSEEEQSTEEDETERVQTSTSLRVGSKKVTASGRGNLGKGSASMASLLKTRSKKRLSQQREDMKQQGMSLLQMKPKEKILQPPGQKVHPEQSGGISSQAISQHNGQSKTVIAPGTLGIFIRMKEISKENERLPEQKKCYWPANGELTMAATKSLGISRFDLLDKDDENEGYQSSDPYGIEEQNIDLVIQKTIDLVLAQDPPTDQLEKGEDYVLSSIGALWHTYKSRLKKTHYLPYDYEKDRWKNQPKTVPDAHFKELLGYWDLEEVKEKAENKAPSEAVMYKETHKMIEGRKYKTSHDDGEGEGDDGEGDDEYDVERNVQSIEREDEDCEDS
ncbi:hypothetical protein PHJA_001667500 [Phtheirospermum japonicum]|uniref:Uncharacterized protein n=1 Tax=Phtheirospermum japonicum TaxID=374723 RepID=A0A830CLD8_9LAMI|nr:hypothetical protein PHJA_001667500 [Phtheirospermum japonicum]